MTRSYEGLHPSPTMGAGARATRPTVGVLPVRGARLVQPPRGPAAGRRRPLGSSLQRLTTLSMLSIQAVANGGFFAPLGPRNATTWSRRALMSESGFLA